MLDYLIILVMWTSQVYANSTDPSYSTSDQWLNFMQYQKSSNQAYQSRVTEGTSFFMSSLGNQNPEAELRQSLEAFADPSEFLKNGRGHPQCLYPARYITLKKQFGLQIKDVSCPAFDSWFQMRKEGDVEIVYAAQYLSNPASIMGHTFIKFENPKVVNNLNLATGYAADIPPNTSAAAYISNGLFGGFKGVFAEFPYYRKVHEYTIIDSRDLWEYKLALTPEQKKLFLAYIWELSLNAEIPYHFTNQNCSSEILAALQAVVPGAKLLDRSSSFYLTPIDSIQRISKNNLIKSEHFRPSLRRQFDTKYAELSSEQTGVFNDALRNSHFPEKSDAIVLETLLEYYSLRRQQNEDQLSTEESAFESKVLLARSELASGPAILSRAMPSSPLLAHPPRNISVSAGSDSAAGRYQILKFRPGVHAFMDRDEGYLENSSFNFFEISGMKQENNIAFAELKFVDVKNQPNFDLVHRDLTWGFKFAYDKGQQISCYNCKMVSAAPEFGLSSHITNWFQASLLGISDIRFSPSFSKGYECLLGAKVEGVLKFRNRFKFLAEIGSQSPVLSTTKVPITSIAGEFKYFNVLKNVDIGSRVLYQHQRPTKADLAVNSIEAGFAF